MKKVLIVSALLLAVLIKGPAPKCQPIPFHDDVINGIASWYSEDDPGVLKTTANMEIFDDQKLTCAIWDIPFNTLIKVTNISNGKSVVVRVNDRGPARRLVSQGRIIDLSKSAFAKIADLDKGLIDIELVIVSGK